MWMWIKKIIYGYISDIEGKEKVLILFRSMCINCIYGHIIPKNIVSIHEVLMLFIFDVEKFNIGSTYKNYTLNV